jgi:hypothetical protein
VGRLSPPAAGFATWKGVLGGQIRGQVKPRISTDRMGWEEGGNMAGCLSVCDPVLPRSSSISFLYTRERPVAESGQGARLLSPAQIEGTYVPLARVKKRRSSM